MTLLAPIHNLIKLALPIPAPVTDLPFDAASVARYQRLADGGADALDAQTWTDLMLPQYSACLAPGTSIFGRQELHRRLQSPAAIDPAARTEHVRELVADDAARQRVQAACEGLRRAECDVSDTVFGAQLAPAPRWSRWLGALPLGFMAVVVLALATGWWPLWGMAVVLWLLLLAIQLRWQHTAASWQRELDTMGHLLRAHGTLAGLDDAVAAPLRPDAAAAAKLNRRLWQLPLGFVPGLQEYSDWVLLRNIRHHFASREVVTAHLPLLRSSFARVAMVEADLALARHLVRTPRSCWAASGEGHAARFAFEHAVHPLLDVPAPLSLRVGDDGRGAFISGRNGIGKSTLLRTVGLNLVTARAFGFCYADAAVTPGLPVYASMQNEDTLEGCESLYMAEVRRAGELLALARRGPAIFLIDEIFRGTNHLESVSGAAAVLDTLAESGCVLVSSHNLILAPLLARRLAPLCVARADGRLQAEHGVLKETNGISLLAAVDVDGVLAAKAGRVHDRLAAYYLAYPQACESVLE